MDLTNLQAYNKLWVSLIVGVVVMALKHFNLPVDQTLQDAIGVVVLSFLVWFVPNKKVK